MLFALLREDKLQWRNHLQIKTPIRQKVHFHCFFIVSSQPWGPECILGQQIVSDAPNLHWEGRKKEPIERERERSRNERNAWLTLKTTVENL